MSTLAIKTDKLSKRYAIGVERKNYNRIGDHAIDLLISPFKRLTGLLRGNATAASELEGDFWALQDVSVEINQGEVVGIIGRNGAGKSTLLKILSRITDPTSGEAFIYGRVGSLLEVGTGFHPELTGRENVFLNGAVLGMKRKEIARKFDEIIAFAEIDKFIETPVKHYSSGMYVRLAFSVAAHLEPEILLVDEVLAVGDIAFQRKCLGKMDDVAQQGRTVVFVSHNMGLMQTLCERGIVLENGNVIMDGSITAAVDKYLETLENVKLKNPADRTDRKGVGDVKLVGLEITSNGNDAQSGIRTGQPTSFTFHVNKALPGMNCSFFLHDNHGQNITAFKSKIRGPIDSYHESGDLSFVCDIDELLLLPGRYRLDVSILGDNRLQDFLEAAATFDVGAGLVNGRPAESSGNISVTMPHRWTLPRRN